MEHILLKAVELANPALTVGSDDDIDTSSQIDNVSKME